MSEQTNREKEIFNEAIEMASPEARQAYLKGACGSDAILRERVVALLKAYEAAAEGFIETKDTEVGESPREHSGSAEATSRETGPNSGKGPASTERVGEFIGRYKLLQQIGEGGCGVVYMAEQSEPVRRRVALKVIKLGMDTKSVVARFEAERQALAMMDHPNIAKVFDAGATETGRPYFVMELVRGTRITEYCDQNSLSTAERLALFTQVCQAIHHAHQKGIIHRDIKPSNILVTVNDGAPVPMVIDFGIAKATNQQQLTDKTLFTAFEQFIGTPAYMSPEQAELTCLDVDTRSDIYSLGVLLYELLTGRTPFDAKTLLQSGLDEMRRVIREEEPSRPSTCLSTLAPAALTTVAQQRQADARKLIHSVRGDLDRIVMKALDKDRKRRYDSASGLAADVNHYLRDEPVSAIPPSFVYLTWKWTKRRRREFAFATMICVLTSLVIAVQEQRKVAALARTRAQTEALEHEQQRSRIERTANLQKMRLEEAEVLGRGKFAKGEFVDRPKMGSSTEERDQLEQCLSRLAARVRNREGTEADHNLLAKVLTSSAKLTAPAIQTIEAPGLGWYLDGFMFYAVKDIGVLVRGLATANGRELAPSGWAYVTGAAGGFGFGLKDVITTPGVWHFGCTLEVQLVDSHGELGSWYGARPEGFDLIGSPVRVNLPQIDRTILAQMPADYPKEIVNEEQVKQISRDLVFTGGQLQRRDDRWYFGEIQAIVPRKDEQDWAHPFPVALQLDFVKFDGIQLQEEFGSFINGSFVTQGVATRYNKDTLSLRLSFDLQFPDSAKLEPTNTHQLEISIRSSRKVALAHDEVEHFLAFPEIRRTIPLTLKEGPH